MSNDDYIIKSLIAAGLIGGALGALLSKNKEEETTLGAIAGAVILATYKANKEAQKTNLPMYIEEEGKLFEIQPGGDKRFVKNINKPDVQLSEYFQLK